MNRKYKFHDNDKLCFISFATVHWIDIFVRKEYMKIILDSWKLCQQHNKPTEIKDREMFDKTLEYIHLNPVMAGFVTKGKIGSIAVQEIFLFPITIARKD